MLDPVAYLATLSQGGGVGDTPLYSILKLTAVPVLATILHTGPLTKNVFVESKLSSYYLSEVSLEKKSPVISLKGFRQNLTNLSNCP